MTTIRTFVKWNNNDPQSVKRAEKLKTKLENDGYTLHQTDVNPITGKCVLTYIIEHDQPLWKLMKLNN